MTTWRDYVDAWLLEHERNRAWLAKHLGVTATRVTQLLDPAGRTPRGTTILRIEKAMGLRPQQLLRLAVQEAVNRDQG